MTEETVQTTPAETKPESPQKRAWARRKAGIYASDERKAREQATMLGEVIKGVVNEALGEVTKRLEALETAGPPSITVTTKDGQVIKTPGLGTKQTLPLREVRYPTPEFQGKAWWIECPNGHVAAWMSGEHPWHPCAPEVIDLISDPDRWHRLKPGFDDKRVAIRGQLPSCTFCGGGVPVKAAGVGSKVFNIDAKYLREGPPPNADEYGYPVR